MEILKSKITIVLILIILGVVYIGALEHKKADADTIDNSSNYERITP